MKNIRILKHLSILVIILVVPGFLYYLLQAKGKNRYKPLPFYGEKKLSGTFHKKRGKKIADTLYYQAKPVSLVKIADDRPDSLFHPRKITIVQFFYTRDTLLVPKMFAAMDRLAGQYRKNGLVGFASVSLDEQFDSLPVLRKYMAAYPNYGSGWSVYRGAGDSTIALAQQGLMVNAAKLPSGRYIFSDKVVLLDPERHIRGYYEIGRAKEEARLNDELKVQIAEELRKEVVDN
ncbi:MAG: SCO family protein [Mucilaginibacter polytrichastri]|nr:SCO family protein [Mucilaginibacter polytrichastri]